ncbi:MAG: GUN4 domain-containing protein [Nodosilinea sp. LVE1205-7]|jgi:hypothetical protein
MSEQFDVFLAHNSRDKPQVRVIANELKRRGLNPWLDEEQILAGDSIPSKVRQGLIQSRTAVFLIGSFGLGKFQEIWELDTLIMLCYQRDLRIIPILLPGVTVLPEQLVFFLGRKYLQFHQSVDETEPLNELVQILKAETAVGITERERGFDRATEVLRKYLSEGRFQEANLMTLATLFLATGRGEESWLRVEDIENFPCQDLRTINQLWLDYSDGKFGFSIQKEIYQDLGGTREFDGHIWGQFCDRVGWIRHGVGLFRNQWDMAGFSDITFNLNAPRGHLPFVWRIAWNIGPWRVVRGWRAWFSVPSEKEEKTITREKLWLLGLFFSRINACDL